MGKLFIALAIFFTYTYNYGQEYKKHQSKHKHKGQINSIATSDSLFATSSYDKSVIIWDYNGKVIHSYQLDDGKINSLCFIPHSNLLLVGITEMAGGEIKRHIVKCLNVKERKVEYDLIDQTLDQEGVNDLYNKNTVGVRNALDQINKTSLPQLNIKKKLNTPQIKDGISHIELIQSMTVSPSGSVIATIDKFNLLKIWDQNHHVSSAFKITNNKKDTQIFFRADSIIFIEPNIIFNIKDSSTQLIKGFERYSSLPLKNHIYFHFNYNDDSRPEKLYNLNTSTSKELSSKDYYTIASSCSDDKYALLGVDGLIRIMDTGGSILSTFGKDRNELITFRGEKIQLFSKIKSIAFSSNGHYLISGEEDGKVIIWRSE